MPKRPITYSVEMTPETSKRLQEWRDELKLHDYQGKPLNVRRLCEIIIEDFAEEYAQTKRMMLNELTEKEDIESPSPNELMKKELTQDDE